MAFIPMLLIASAYYYVNKADPDCGTSFSWVTRAFGPHTGWITGWVIMAADAIQPGFFHRKTETAETMTPTAEGVTFNE